MLADIPMEVSANFPLTRDFLSDYLTEEKPLLKVSVTRDDILKEAKCSPFHYSEEYLETVALYRKVATSLLEYDVLVAHGSAIAFCDEGFLFSAPSGTGKSTHAALWKQIFHEEVTIVNDDKPLLRLKDGEFILYGTPWAGKHHLSTSISVPLKGIAFLQQVKENEIEIIAPSEVFPLLLQQVYRPPGRRQTQRVLRLLDELLQAVPCYRLKCNMAPEAAMMAKEYMTKR